MNCSEFEDRVQHLLDQREPPASDAKLRAHADGCSRCAARLDAYQDLIERIARSQPPVLDAEFSRRVVRLAFPASPVRRTTRWRGRESRYIAIALVACLMLIAALSRARYTSTKVTPASRELALSVLSVPVTGDSGPNKSQGLESTAEPTPRSRPGSTDPMIDEDWRAFWESWSNRLVTDQFESLDALAQGIRPITASLTTALDSLRTAFPLGADQSTIEADEDSAAAGGNGLRSLMG